MARSLLLLALLALPASAGWSWKFADGYLESPDVPAPTDPDSADELAAAGEFPAAARRFTELASAATELDVRRLAWTKAADAWLAAGEWRAAFDIYEYLVKEAPTHAEGMRLRRFQIDAAILGIRMGAGFEWFGAVRGRPWAEKQARDLLGQFAHEDFSMSRRLALALALLESERPEEAAVEYEWFLAEYPKSVFAPTARFMKGEAHLATHQGVVYDPAPLADAAREYRRYLDEYPEGDRAEDARNRLLTIDVLRAHKDYLAARHYHRIGKWRSALMYYESVAEKYPDTEWAEKAREELPAIRKKVEAMPPQDRKKK